MYINIHTDIILYEEENELSDGYIFVTQQFFKKNHILQIDLLQDWITELEQIKETIMAAAYGGDSNDK